MPTGISLTKALSSGDIDHWFNICDEFNTDHMPPVNLAQVLTRHLQPRWPCCCSSFHHFHSPMFPLSMHNHADVGHSKGHQSGCIWLLSLLQGV